MYDDPDGGAFRSRGGFRNGGAHRAGEWLAGELRALVGAGVTDVKVERDSSRLFNSDQSELRAIMRADTWSFQMPPRSCASSG